MPLYNPRQSVPLQQDSAPVNNPAMVPVNYTEVADTPEQFVMPISNQQQYAPAPRMVEQTQTTQKNIPRETQKILGGAMSDLASANDDRMEALKALQTYEAKKIRAETDALNNKMIEQEALEQNMQARNDAYTAAVNTAEKNIVDAESEFKNAGIDGMRIFKGDNNNRALAAISLALGAFGSALTGQKNYAIDMINGVIERDIEEQKYEANKKYTSFENAKKERAIVDSRFNTDVERMALQKSLRLDAINTELEKVIANAKNDQIRGNALNLQAEVKQQSAALKTNIFQKAVESASTTTTTQAMPSGPTQAEYAIHQKNWTPEGEAPNPESAGLVKTALSDKSYLNKQLDFAINAVKKYGLNDVTPEGRAALDRATDTVVQAMQQKYNSGVLNPGEYKTFAEDLGLNRWQGLFKSTNQALARLEGIRESVNQKTQAIIETNIMKPAKAKYTPATFQKTGK